MHNNIIFKPTKHELTEKLKDLEQRDLVQCIVEVHTTLYRKIEETVEPSIQKFADHLFTNKIISDDGRKSKDYSKIADEFLTRLNWMSSQEQIESHCQHFLASLRDVSANGAMAAKTLKQAWQNEASTKLGVVLFSGTSTTTGVQASRSSLWVCFCRIAICTISLFILIVSLLFLYCVISHSADSHLPASSMNILINEEVISSIEEFENIFLYLLSDIQTSLNKNLVKDEDKLEHFGRFLCNKFNVSYKSIDYHNDDPIDHYFQKIKSHFNFMSISLLQKIDQFFLNGTYSSEIESYKESVEKFIGSTPITELREIIRTDVTKIKEERITIVLKLGHSWNNKNHTNLNHFVHFLFGDDASLMQLIKIHRRVLTVHYTLPSTLYLSAVKKINQNRKILSLGNAVSVKVKDEVITIPRFDEDNKKQDYISLALFEVLDYHNNTEMTNDMKFLIAIGGNVNYHHPNHEALYTPLSKAVSLGNVAGVKTLLGLQANPNLLYGNAIVKTTVLMFAIAENKLKIAEELLYHGADTDIQALHGMTALIFSAAEGLDNFVELLLKHGANPNIKDAQGNTALHFASVHGYCQIASLLLTHSADPNLRNSFHQIPLHLAASIGSDKCVRMLLKSFNNVNIEFHSGITSLMLASNKNHPSTVRILLEYGADPFLRNANGYTSLLFSAIADCSECVQAHLESGVDPNYQTIQGFAVLHIASLLGHISTMKALLSCWNTNVNILADICPPLLLQPVIHPLLKATFCNSPTPLRLAVQNKKSEVVRLLLNHGGNPNVYLGRFSALGMATNDGHLEIVQLLLEHKVHINEHRVVSPLLLAVHKGYIDVVVALINAGIDVNKWDTFYKATALKVAAMNGNVRMVKLLLSAGASMTVEGDYTVFDMVIALLRDSFGFDLNSIHQSNAYLVIFTLLSSGSPYIQSHQRPLQLDSTDINSTSSVSTYEIVYKVKYILEKADKSRYHVILSDVQKSRVHHSEFAANVSKEFKIFQDFSSCTEYEIVLDHNFINVHAYSI